ncbi:potassium transporter 10-like isoform X1 [Syzygium oleosum]|uniref:potassium transporter 10-like isoform X1 n=1 Tax=Syzygium oleosum TaxID=219896 RepID=UPI0011D18138|nr:potassium transporter 10-like isoform X1 [Syzygium oleosum]
MVSREQSSDGTDKTNSVWVLDHAIDNPMDQEAGKLRNTQREKKISTLLLLRLAFQSLGVVFGDLGTSPLYVFYNTFPNGVNDPEDVIGALSVIIYSLTLIPLIKYIFIVSRANDSGQGGTFALYSLLCRHANIKTIPNQDRTDEELTTYSRSIFVEHSFAAKTKRWLEGRRYRKSILLILVIIGSCMVIGDGILTPAISVLSAAGGIKLDQPKMSDEVVVLVSVIILVGLFSIQHYGTDRIAWLCAPVVFLWFVLIGGIGIINIWKYDTHVLKAFSPVYIYLYFKKGGINGWTSLGGTMLSITGTEAVFADLSHFPVSSIQIAFTVVVFPALLLAYCGQAAFLIRNPDHVVDLFYRSIPESIYWPVFLVATAAAIVASQATISATFSLIKQALALGCFPRVKVVHTSKKFLQQIYIPDINWVLMILCVAVTAGFKNQTQIGNASGTAVAVVMLVTTFLMILIMILVWRCHWILVVIFTVLSLIVEGTYFTAVLFKVNQGGWVPLAIAGAFFIIMYAWHYGSVKRYEFEMHSKVSMAYILGLGPSLGLVRVPGIGLVYTELARGVPPIFSHFITNLPAIHSVVIFVCVKYLPVYTVPVEERFLIRRIGPKNFHMFRCVARYGYKDLHKKDDDFEEKLFESLHMFVRVEYLMEECSESEISFCGQQTQQSNSEECPPNDDDNNSLTLSSIVDLTISSVGSIVPVESPVHLNARGSATSNRGNHCQNELNEIEFLSCCRAAGIVHILGNTVVKAQRGSNLFKLITINYVYALLRKMCRENSAIFNVPHESLLNVGQVFYV